MLFLFLCVLVCNQSAENEIVIWSVNRLCVDQMDKK